VLISYSLMRFYLFRGEGCEYEEFVDVGDGVWEVSERHRSRVRRGPGRELRVVGVLLVNWRIE
jgi:hypothetical protein